MTKLLEAMKAAITNAVESEAAATSGVMITYFHGKVIGVLELSVSVLSRREYTKVWEHYKSEQARLL